MINGVLSHYTVSNTEVCHYVAIEPVLQPLSGESFHYATANVEDKTATILSVIYSSLIPGSRLSSSGQSGWY